MLELARQVTLNASATGVVRIQQNNPAVVWWISQINVFTSPFDANCVCVVSLNNLYLCATVAGSDDSATGPPDLEFDVSDELEIVWSGGTNAGALATVILHYSEYVR